MLSGKSIGVVIPAYNEELLIGKTLSTMPAFVDKMIVVNDASVDRTREIILQFQKEDPRVELVNHDVNRGLGQSLIDGYLKAIELNMDITAVMAGDAQMSPADLPAVVGPIVAGETEYVKGYRLLHEDVIERMPRHRFIGNAVLTLLTKFATGYWHVIDPQCGYTAIALRALQKIPITRMTKGYGYNADILNMLNMHNFRVKDVEVEPVYGDEQSKIRLHSYIPKVSALLFRLTMKRLVNKYLVREFHPLVLFYLFSVVSCFGLVVPLVIRFFYYYFKFNEAPQTTLIILTFSTTMAFFSFFFGMWLDMEDNRRLKA